MDDHSTDEFIQHEILSVGYAFGGQEIAVDDPHCLAKEVENKSMNSKQYFVKTLRGARGMGGFANPSSPDFHPSVLTAFLKHVGRPAAEFVKVKKEVFDLYKIFLRTKNSVFCRQAEQKCV